jgi:3-hydroxybutyryl-CoA dehydrogenase
MGSGIAQVAAQAGFPVVVREVTPDLVDKGLKSIEKNLARDRRGKPQRTIFLHTHVR